MTPGECALKVLNDYKITNIPALNFNRIFKANDIICVEKKFSDINYSGSLCRKGEKAAILINNACDYIPRINFTKAHELGHFFLKHKGDKFECTTQDMKTRDKVNKPQEVEANRFASSFLLPKDTIELLLDDDIFDISTISEIASSYMVSLSVATLRVVPLLKGVWCAIWTKDGIVEWVVKSPAFNFKVIPSGEQIKSGSVAYKCYSENFQPYKGEYIRVSGDCWIKSPPMDDVLELTRPLGNYNATLSLIKVK